MTNDQRAVSRNKANLQALLQTNEKCLNNQAGYESQQTWQKSKHPAIENKMTTQLHTGFTLIVILFKRFQSELCS